MALESLFALLKELDDKGKKQRTYYDVANDVIEKLRASNDERIVEVIGLVHQAGYDTDPSVLADNFATILELNHHEASIGLYGRGYQQAEKIGYVAEMNLIGNPISINDLKDN